MRRDKVDRALTWAKGYLPHLRDEYLPEGADCLQTLMSIAQVFREPPMMIVGELDRTALEALADWHHSPAIVMENPNVKITPLTDWNFPETPVDTAVWRALSKLEASL